MRTTTLVTLFTDLVNLINGTLMPVLFSIAFLFFAWNVARLFIFELDAKNAQKRKQQVIYGVAAMVVILSFWGVVALLVSGLGLSASRLPQSDLEKTLREYQR